MCKCCTKGNSRSGYGPYTSRQELYIIIQILVLYYGKLVFIRHICSVFCSLTSKINISVKFWDILLKLSLLFLILPVVYAHKISEKSEGVWWASWLIWHGMTLNMNEWMNENILSAYRWSSWRQHERLQCRSGRW